MKKLRIWKLNNKYIQKNRLTNLLLVTDQKEVKIMQNLKTSLINNQMNVRMMMTNNIYKKQPNRDRIWQYKKNKKF